MLVDRRACHEKPRSTWSQVKVFSRAIFVVARIFNLQHSFESSLNKWSDCSATCGVGLKYRNLRYNDGNVVLDKSEFEEKEICVACSAGCNYEECNNGNTLSRRPRVHHNDKGRIWSCMLQEIKLLIQIHPEENSAFPSKWKDWKSCSSRKRFN